MTPTHTDSPLRRSEIGVFRVPVRPPVINDDEAERREARRRTILNESVTSSASTIEETETLKNCLKIYSENKLSKDNAWSVSLIDTLSALLDKHHKSLNNFKVAGSSLEASSKVYSLRVDSIHTDVVRMSAGLGKNKVVQENHDDENNMENNIPSDEVNAEGAENQGENQQKQKPKKRVRKQVSTITKNKETINGRLDTNPFTDPIFAKLNSIVGSINSSNRLLQNILPSHNSELKIRMDYPFWDSNNVNVDSSFSEEYPDCQTVQCPKLSTKFDDCVLRANHTGYVIADTPFEPGDEEENEKINEPESIDSNKTTQLALAFDLNAEVEPIPSDTPAFVDVDMDDFDELTTEEQYAINKCKGLRRAPVMIEDMRPVDSTSINLEYSYRPIDKISQFWAGPSHWKFKKHRNKSIGITSNLAQTTGGGPLDPNKRNSKQKRKPLKARAQQLQFGEVHDSLFQKLDEKHKLRKANIQKKWDAKKLKLPTDLQIEHNIFDVYSYAPGLEVLEEVENVVSPDLPIESGYDYNNPVDQEYCSNIIHDDDVDTDNATIPEKAIDECMDQTVVEIATDFDGAPDKIIKIVVPFAKRAKVIDMKQLKKCCKQIIQNKFCDTEKENIPNSPEFKEERYKLGYASFNDIYDVLPNLLTPSMTESLSTSVAFYSILHLANDLNLRLIQKSDLNDFQIRQLDV